MEGVVLEDADGRLTFANPAAAAMLGYSSQELIGRHWTLIIPADQHAIVEAADRRRAAGAADRYELELLCRDGSRLAVLVSGSPRGSADGYQGSLAVFTEIGVLKQTEEALRSTNEMLRALVEAAPLAITVLEPDGRVRLWNAASEKLFGWVESEVLGRFNPIVPPDKLEEHQQLRHRAMRGELLDNVEVTRRRKDGSSVDIRL
jgi:PAS domain S-box-containing protein